MAKPLKRTVCLFYFMFSALVQRVSSDNPDSAEVRNPNISAGHNKTRTLLLRRSPKFTEDGEQNITGVIGQNVRVEFRVRANTTELANCTMRKLNQSESLPVTESIVTRPPADRDCSSFSNLTGTPPDLTLTVQLDNVMKEEEGQWRLELTNDVGTGYKIFTLVVADKPDSDTTPGTHEDETRSSSLSEATTVAVVSTSPAPYDDRDEKKDDDSTTKHAGKDSITIQLPVTTVVLVGAILGAVVVIVIVVVIVAKISSRRRGQRRDGSDQAFDKRIRDDVIGPPFADARRNIAANPLYNVTGAGLLPEETPMRDYQYPMVPPHQSAAGLYSPRNIRRHQPGGGADWKGPHAY